MSDLYNTKTKVTTKVAQSRTEEKKFGRSLHDIRIAEL